MMNRVKISRKSLLVCIVCVCRTHTHIHVHIYTLTYTYVLYLFRARSKARESRRGGLQFRLSIHRRENTSHSVSRLLLRHSPYLPSHPGYIRNFGFRLKVLISTYTVTVRQQGAQRTLPFSKQYDSSFQESQSGLLRERWKSEKSENDVRI